MPAPFLQAPDKTIPRIFMISLIGINIYGFKLLHDFFFYAYTLQKLQNLLSVFLHMPQVPLPALKALHNPFPIPHLMHINPEYATGMPDHFPLFFNRSFCFSFCHFICASCLFYVLSESFMYSRNLFAAYFAEIILSHRAYTVIFFSFPFGITLI